MTAGFGSSNIVQKIEELLIAAEEQRAIAASQSQFAQAAAQKAVAAASSDDAQSAVLEASQAADRATQAAESIRKIMQDAIVLLKAGNNKSVRADFLFDKIVVLEGEAASYSVLASRAAAEAKTATSQ